MQSTSLGNETLERFLERLASTDPAPGGGGSVAVATAMAAALVEMAAGLSTDQIAEAAVIGARASDIRRRALSLADEDAAAYTRVLDAFRRRREADADPDAGRREIHEALEGATAVPLEVAGLAADVAGLGTRLVTGGNPNLEGDAAAAVHIARAAARAAARLVELNVAQGKLDGDWCDQAAAHVTRAETGTPAPPE